MIVYHQNRPVVLVIRDGDRCKIRLGGGEEIVVPSSEVFDYSNYDKLPAMEGPVATRDDGQPKQVGEPGTGVSADGKPFPSRTIPRTRVGG